MTAQMPERMILNGKPHIMHANPLYRLLKSRRTDIVLPGCYTTACYRQYIGTWDIVGEMLTLVDLNSYVESEKPLPEDMRSRFLRLVPAKQFPVPATWFTGKLRIPIGPRLVWGFHGWSSWYARERVITCRNGRVIRDREVDTLAILEWVLRRREELRIGLEIDEDSGGPLTWISEEDVDHLRGDWWPSSWAMVDGRPVPP